MGQAARPVLDDNKHVQHPERRSNRNEEVACKNRESVANGIRDEVEKQLRQIKEKFEREGAFEEVLLQRIAELSRKVAKLERDLAEAES
jgi:hypothetical protein